MEKKNSSSPKFKSFLKKNIYYIIMAICLLAIAAMITVTVLSTQKQPIDVPVDSPIDIPVEVPVEKPIETPIDVPIVVYPVVMVCPVSNPVVGLEYAMDSHVWHVTLGQYSVNDGIDYTGSDGDSVMSAYSGSVKSIEYDILNGYTVVIEHNSTLQSRYSSLNEPTITVGQSVAKGQKIGTMGNTATISYDVGPHVHFSVFENNEIVSPYTFMAQGNK